MKINANELLSPLTEIVEQLGAKKILWTPSKVKLPKPEFEIEMSATKDRQVTEALFSNPKKLFALDGVQCLLYIPDGESKKFHFMECRTIRDMRSAGRFERYIVTNKTSGKFKTFIRDSYYGGRVGEEREVRLAVCRNCLSALNYKNYNNNEYERDDIVANFDITTFFESCKTYFLELPMRTDQSILIENAYLQNWDAITNAYREAQDWTCEQCGVKLKDRPHLLHTHHLNGNKQDVRAENLRVLCAICHKAQPHHGHMQEPSDADKAFIMQRRHEIEIDRKNLNNL